MDIPERLSDMDSIPETVSLGRNHGALAAMVRLELTMEGFLVTGNRLIETMETANTAIAKFVQVAEVCELECLYSLKPSQAAA